jgi:NifB/MoaA-like Fe-S oxidoreductase
VEVPVAAAYEGFVVAEDGVGLVRRFEDSFRRSVARRRHWRAGPPVTVVTGEMYRPRLSRLLAGLTPYGVEARVVGVPNDFFGRDIAVAGLLTGQDIRRHLGARADLGAWVLVPAVTVRDGEKVFLDDLTPGDLARDLGVPVRIVEPTARALLRALVRAA